MRDYPAAWLFIAGVWHGASDGRIVPSKHPGVRHLVTMEPIAPVAAFSPWDFPTTIPARKIAAALEAGMVGINFVGVTGPETPFGGGKDSGYGSQSGRRRARRLSVHKYIAQG